MISWKMPPQGVVKVNWDVAINNKNGFTGCGIIARDFEESWRPGALLKLLAWTRLWQRFG
jgi:hypothetical protein